MTLPIWATNPGFLGTVTERVTIIGNTAIQITATNATSLSVISGSIPSGLLFTSSSSTGIIAGAAFSVRDTIRSQFVVRAANSEGISDRTFAIDTVGASAPVWLTPAGQLKIGTNGRDFSLTREYISYQLVAVSDISPDGKKLTFYIGDNEGELPPGVTLTSSGQLIGYLNDNVATDSSMSTIGGYDSDPYDRFAYDHSVLTQNPAGGFTLIEVKPPYIPKLYQFYVTATDGIASSKQLFSIRVEDPLSLPEGYSLIELIAPIWLTPSNIGYVRANNTQIISLEIYDPYPELGTVSYNWTNPDSNLFTLTTGTGVIYASLPYQPAYDTIYNFTVNVVKNDRLFTTSTVVPQIFSLTVRGDIENELHFVTAPFVGTLLLGLQSELSIVAKNTTGVNSIQYTLVNGALPTGLTLGKDGSIIGIVGEAGQTTFDNGLLIFENGTTTIDLNRTFTVQAKDVTTNASIRQNFTIGLGKTTRAYTQIYASPLLTLDQRIIYSDFLNTDYIFNSSMMYRASDPAFGVQQSIKLYVEHGIQELQLSQYYLAIQNYFRNKKFLFGDVRTIKAVDIAGNYVYDLVGINIIDNASTAGKLQIDSINAYPNSVENWKAAFESIVVGDIIITTDDLMLPRFMQTIQTITGDTLGFILIVPICYALPNMGATIVDRINSSDFDFKSINFDIDRLIIKDNLSAAGPAYFIFGKN